MSKAVFQAIEQQRWSELSSLLDRDPEAVRSTHNLAQAPSRRMARHVVSPLEWAIVRREPKAVEALLKAAPLGEQGRDPEGAIGLALDVFSDDYDEVHLPDRDVYPTVRQALAPPRGRTEQETLRACAQVIVAMDRAGLDWGRDHEGRNRLDWLVTSTESPAHGALKPIIERVQAQRSLANRPRRTGVGR